MKKTTFKLSLLSVFFSLLFFSCSSSNEDNYAKENEKIQNEIEEEKISNENNEKASYLKKKYDAKEINYNLFSSFNQEKFLNDSNLLILKTDIDDIFLNDSSYYLRLADRQVEGYLNEIETKSIIFIRLNKIQFKNIISKLFANYKKEERIEAISKNPDTNLFYNDRSDKTGVFIVKVQSFQNTIVNNLNAKFSGEPHENTDNNGKYYFESDITTSIEGKTSDLYIIKGDLIDFHINKKRK